MKIGDKLTDASGNVLTVTELPKEFNRVVAIETLVTRWIDDADQQVIQEYASDKRQEELEQFTDAELMEVLEAME